MNEWLRGRILAKNIEEKVRARIEKLDQPLGLGVILAGDDKASHLYVSLKESAAKRAGIFVEKAEFDAKAKTEDIRSKVKEFNNRADIHGILVQLPLPDGIDENIIIDTIDPLKDVDGFKEENLDKLDRSEASLVPPVALAIMRLIQASRQPLRGKHAVIISNNEIFSRPISKLLEESNITAQYLSPESSALASKTRAADILIVAVGRLGFIKEDMVKEGSILIDVGTNRTGNKVRGDILTQAKQKAAFASPVPGGIGPLTVSYLLLNVLKAFELQRKADQS